MKFLLLIACFSVLENVNGKNWWDNGNFYQIYPRSFRDSDGDGIGDLNGVTEKLQYIKDLGMTAAWLSPIFQSPMADFGYDISDYYKIHSEYGTNQDLENLIKKAHEIGLKIILDFVPNHTSDEHEWFQKSIDGIEPYKNFYIWSDGNLTNDGKRLPPNNWVNSFRGDAWTWNEKRQQFYLHNFASKQPDLNYRNPKVAEEMEKVLGFWLELGIDGFRVDAVNYLYEREDMASEPLDPSCADYDDFCRTIHIHTKDQPESFELVYSWRSFVEKFQKKFNSEPKILMTEAYTNLENILKFYGNGVSNGSHIPFNFELITGVNKNSNAIDFSKTIDSWLSNMPKDCQANWVMGNHDNKRLASRYGENRADLFNIMLQTLPGFAITYNGEELAMLDVYISWEETVDPQACNANSKNFDSYSRDPARTPFPWNDSLNAGFSEAQKTWLPVGPHYKNNNVELQLNSANSHLKIFKKLVELRKQPSMAEGHFDQNVVGNDILVYKREKTGNQAFIIVLNFGKIDEVINLREIYPNIGSKVMVLATSLQSKYNENDIIDATEFNAYGEVGTILVEV